MRKKVYTNCNMEQTKKIDETKVLIVGCKNEELLKKVNALAEAEGVQLVVLEDRVVSDYVASHQEPVAENEFFGWNLTDSSMTQHTCCRRSQLFERFHRLFCQVLLHKP